MRYSGFMGRKHPKISLPKKTELIKFRSTDDEAVFLDGVAARLGVTRSALIRHCLYRNLEEWQLVMTLDKKDCRRLGVNIMARGTFLTSPFLNQKELDNKLINQPVNQPEGVTNDEL